MTGDPTYDPLDLPCRDCDAAPRQSCRWIYRGLWTFRRPHHRRVTAARLAASADPAPRRTARPSASSSPPAWPSLIP